MKTNVARILAGLGFDYELKSYEVDENDLSAENVASKVGMPLAQVFKTLVVRGDKTGVFLACVPGAAELDLKAVAMISGNKRTELVALKEVQPLTGYIRGGVSPIGTKKRFQVYLDESALSWPVIAVSGGIRGCQVIVSPDNLLAAVDGKTCSIACYH
ncbi:MAG: ybaK [Firmicutes bacterium]|nr:ybaK [Bacillota bacterium]